MRRLCRFEGSGDGECDRFAVRSALCLLDSFRYLCIKDRMVFHLFFGLGSNSYLTSLVQVSRQNRRRQEISEVSK